MTGSPDPDDRHLPRLHLVTNDQIVEAASFVGLTERLMAVGGAGLAFHLRAKRATGARFWSLAEICSRLAEASGARLIVNERADVAAACGSFGIQLGQSSMGPAAVRRFARSGQRIGVSVHSVSQALRAVDEGADFILAGTLFTSQSHPGGEVTGLAWLGPVTSLGRPVLGIGGIGSDRVPEVLRAGAYGVAVISAVWRAGDPEQALRELLRQLEQESEADA